VKPVSGHLEITDKGFGFLRDIGNNFRPDPEDSFVPAHRIRQWRLSEGVFIEGEGEKGKGKNRNRKLAAVGTVNGLSLERYGDIGTLQDQVSVHPSERFELTQGPQDLMGRTLDIIVPIGKGQRGLIVSPPKAGKTTILKHMAESLAMNHPEAEVFVLLVDERPEEVTDFKRGLQKATVLFSSSDQSLAQHMRMTRLAMNTAMRVAETAKDAVVFIDSLTRMARAFNAETRSHGRTLSGGLAATAMEIPRKIFGAARNVEHGGSLTIIASILVDTGSRMDDIIFQEFKGTGNMELVLSRACAEQRIWPAVNIQASGTRNEQLLLDKKEYDEVVQIRRTLARLDETAAMSTLLEHLDRDG
jgi:transcription termination factor Rho